MKRKLKKITCEKDVEEDHGWNESQVIFKCVVFVAQLNIHYIKLNMG
jgi:hypothetical protein